METGAEANTRESVLILSAANGDLEAFNDLVLKYQDQIYNLANAILGDPDSAEDAAQETFINAFQHIGSFRGGLFRSWLHRIATNVCYSYLRTAKRHPSAALLPEDRHGNELESPPWLADPRPSPHVEMERVEISQALYRRLDELPATYRSVIVLVDLNQFDYAEAAQILHIPTGTVKSRLARARLQMKEKLSRDFYSLSKSPLLDIKPQSSPYTEMMNYFLEAGDAPGLIW